MPDSSPLTSGYGSVLIAVTPTLPTEPSRRLARQFTLMFAALITGAQRAISPSMRARNSAGLLPIGSINCAASFSRIAAVPIASTTSR